MPNISGYYTYTTQEGDTFDLLALDMYDDEKWHITSFRQIRTTPT